MPELPEIESFRRLLLTHCLNKEIEKVDLNEAGGGALSGKPDTKVIDQSLKASELVGRSLVDVQRKGKHLLLTFSDPEKRHLIVHFGMTGQFCVRGAAKGAIQYFSAKHEKEVTDWPPKFSKLSMTFKGEVELVFIDPRRLGHVTGANGPLSDHESLSDLAADPLHDFPSLAAFTDLLNKSGNRPIKTVLLDQNAVVCGLGNYLADEILHDAHIHPNTKRPLLTEEVIKKLHVSIVHIVSKACECVESGTDFPVTWVFHGRWDSKKEKAKRGSKYSEIKVGGRATLFDPTTQIEVGGDDTEPKKSKKRAKVQEDED